MIPAKLEEGDELRVVSPARSLAIIAPEVREIAQDRLKALGLVVSFSKNAEETGMFNSSSIESRVSDLHEAFSDPDVSGIITTIGGWNSNQLLSHLDYDLIRKNKKVLCGYSDITALQSTIYEKTGVLTYSGPHFSSFGMREGIEYTIEYFEKCLMSESPFEVLPSPSWSEDEWYLDQENRTFHENEGHFIINEGLAQGEIVGGNLGTLSLLFGTDFMPDLKGKVLFLEDCAESESSYLVEFDRQLQSLIHQPGFSEIKGIVLGRFQHVADFTREKIVEIVESKSELDEIPVVGGVDFGHTTPQITFPIGGTADLAAEGDEVKIEILTH